MCNFNRRTTVNSFCLNSIVLVPAVYIMKISFKIKSEHIHLCELATRLTDYITCPPLHLPRCHFAFLLEIKTINFSYNRCNNKEKKSRKASALLHKAQAAKSLHIQSLHRVCVITNLKMKAHIQKWIQWPHIDRSSLIPASYTFYHPTQPVSRISSRVRTFTH